MACSLEIECLCKYIPLFKTKSLVKGHMFWIEFDQKKKECIQQLCYTMHLTQNKP